MVNQIKKPVFSWAMLHCCYGHHDATPTKNECQYVCNA